MKILMDFLCCLHFAKLGNELAWVCDVYTHYHTSFKILKFFVSQITNILADDCHLIILQFHNFHRNSCAALWFLLPFYYNSLLKLLCCCHRLLFYCSKLWNENTKCENMFALHSLAEMTQNGNHNNKNHFIIHFSQCDSHSQCFLLLCHSRRWNLFELKSRTNVKCVSHICIYTVYISKVRLSPNFKLWI